MDCCLSSFMKCQLCHWIVYTIKLFDCYQWCFNFKQNILKFKCGLIFFITLICWKWVTRFSINFLMLLKLISILLTCLSAYMRGKLKMVSLRLLLHDSMFYWHIFNNVMITKIIFNLWEVATCMKNIISMSWFLFLCRSQNLSLVYIMYALFFFIVD